jgi:tetratricopeptide (TPR) repeat protein
MARFAVEDYSTAFTDLHEALTLARDNLRTESDVRQLAEILNNLGCLAYAGGDIDKSLLYFHESLQIQTMLTEHSVYDVSRFSQHTASLNMSITRANIGFLSLVMRDFPESVSVFESALKVSKSAACFLGGFINN